MRERLMIRVPLHLRPSPDAVRETRAYFLPGGDSAAWIATIASWGVPMGPLRLYVLPQSLQDRSPLGVLVVGEGLPHDAESPACLPYGRIGGKLHVPADSVVWPPMSEQEVGRLLPGHLYAMHPSAGLVGFDEADALAMHQLIAAPAAREESWDRAVAGVLVASQLRSVSVPPMPSPQDLLDQGRGDIGDDSPAAIGKLPDDPAGSAAGRVAGMIALGLAGMVKALSDKLGGKGRAGRPGGAGTASGGAAGSGLGGFAAWIGRKFAGLTERMMAARFKEIARLMRLMETDPDQGLRYALPLSGLANRGLAAPGDRLTARSTQFNLGMLGGGQAADFWNVPPDYQYKLMQQYRQAANREIGLGRFRRAAYIFAVLLGDYHGAANALRQGRHFREAAAIYKDHLRNTAEAARCLEQGGLLTEAIPLYEEQEQFEKAGDLYAALERAADAEAAYRKAVRKACAGRKRVAAAGILERKLKAIDEALDLLAAAWPDEPQAVECLKARFALLGRVGRHGDSRLALKPLRESTPARHSLPLIAALVETTAAYPDRPTRHDMADAARVVASSALPAATPSDAAVVAHALARLCPEDRLLRRDAERYSAKVSRERIAKRTIAAPSPDGRGKRIPLLRSFDLPKGAAWASFASAHGALYAAGYDWGRIGAKLTAAGSASPPADAIISEHGVQVPHVLPSLLAHNWQDESTVVRLRQNYSQEEPLLMAADPRERGHVLLATLYGRRLTERETAFDGGIVRVGMPSWAPDNIAGVTFDSTGQAWMLVAVNNQLHLSCYSPEGELRQSQLLAMLPFETVPSVPLMVCRGDDLWFAVNNWLVWCRCGAQAGQEEMPSRILSLSATLPNSLIRLAVTLEEGGRVVMTGSNWPQQLRFGEGMLDPVASFTNDGYLVAASKGAGRVYDLCRGQMKHFGDFEAPDAAPLAVLSTGKSREFAVATDSRVCIYKIG